MNNVKCELYSVQFEVNSVQFALYNWLLPVYNMQSGDGARGGGGGLKVKLK